MTGGKFVEHQGFKIWVWHNDVIGVLVNGRQTSYEQQAKIKFDGGFINTPQPVN